MGLLLFLHIFSIGIWFGCVAVEAVLERGPWASQVAPQMHYAIDRWVEIPAFSVVLLTGLWMFDLSRFHGLYAVKVICGLLAVGVNIYCLIPVTRRKYAANLGNKAEVRKQTRQIYLTLLIGFPAAAIALAIGLHFLGIY